MEIISRPLRSIVSVLRDSRLPRRTPEEEFRSHRYLRHNQRRLEHLASLQLPIANSSVLEVAAGIGDHTSFLVDRGCTVTSIEGRAENLEILRRRFPGLDVRLLDLERPCDLGRKFDIVYCYGALYHLQHPAEALAFMAHCCQKMLLIETCVSYGENEAVNLIDEDRENPSQSLIGFGCRPTRPWIYNQLSQFFEFVYMPRTQPNHEEFPLDWTIDKPTPELLTRSVFIASREPINNPLLLPELVRIQVRQG